MYCTPFNNFQFIKLGGPANISTIFVFSIFGTTDLLKKKKIWEWEINEIWGNVSDEWYINGENEQWINVHDRFQLQSMQ